MTRLMLSVGSVVSIACVVIGLPSLALAQAGPHDSPDHPTGWFDMAGGWIGISILAVLFLLSLTAGYLVFDQILTLRRREMAPPEQAEHLGRLLASGRIAEAEALCRQQPNVLAYVVLTGLTEWEGGWPAVEKAMEDATAEQSARFLRKVEYLSVIGNLAPMLGLLGTVTGMIMAFEEVASSQGAAGAADLAQGIYQALITTVAGLIVAIPSLGAFAVLRNRIDQLIADVAHTAYHAVLQAKRISRGPGPELRGGTLPSRSSRPAGRPQQTEG